MNLHTYTRCKIETEGVINRLPCLTSSHRFTFVYGPLVFYTKLTYQPIRMRNYKVVLRDFFYEDLSSLGNMN